MDIARYFDAAVLKPDMTPEQVEAAINVEFGQSRQLEFPQIAFAAKFIAKFAVKSRRKRVKMAQRISLAIHLGQRFFKAGAHTVFACIFRKIDTVLHRNAPLAAASFHPHTNSLARPLDKITNFTVHFPKQTDISCILSVISL